MLQRHVESVHFAPGDIATKTRAIYESVLRDSRYLDAGNFTAIHPSDLERLFDGYDRMFFADGCRRALGESHLRFRLSRRMTAAGGKTFRYTPRNGGRPFYEIAVSTTLLYQAFRDEDRPITVTGLFCRDRLEALQRVFEHEMVHLVEMLLWTRSSCAAPRFQAIASRFFGHRKHTHDLITPRERAFTEHGVHPGVRVRFRIDGAEYVGVVNRITRRATVLVEDQRGTRYSDGKRYAKFYVPVGMLEPVE